MVERPGPPQDRDVEAGQVATGGAAVPRGVHRRIVPTPSIPNVHRATSVRRRRSALTHRPGGVDERQCLATERLFDNTVGVQRRFDDLGRALADVTFCIIDLETTGGSPDHDRITEVGAVRMRGGECLGTLQTFVNPGRAIPPSITILTGITEAMVLPAPPVEAVLPSLLEFIGDAVIVGHNVRFDIGFLDAALVRSDRPRLANRRVDTCALARRLVRDEVPNCKLGTLADRFALPHRPSHRALDDALATADLLHVLIERATGLGVTGLDDLLALPTIAGHAQAGKLGLTTSLPRAPGVYLFGNGRGDVLYVGKATDLRQRVRSYFSGDDRRKVGALLRQTGTIDHIVCAHPLEAEVREVRLLQTLTPRYNRHATDPGRYRYVRLAERTDGGLRASITRVVDPTAGHHLGPVASVSAARRVVGALEHLVPDLLPPSRRVRSAAPPTPAPSWDPPSAADALTAIRCLLGLDDDLSSSAPSVFDHLTRLIAALAAHERFEDAAVVRDQAAALAAVVADHHRLGWLHRSAAVTIDAPGVGGVALTEGIVTAVWGPDGQVRPLDTPLSVNAADALAAAATNRDAGPASGVGPVPAWHADELRVVARFLERHATTAHLTTSTTSPSCPWPRLPRFRASAPGGSAGRDEPQTPHRRSRAGGAAEDRRPFRISPARG